jgi:hypothetical protein
MFFFSIRDPQGLICDEEGSECHDVADALDEAAASARDLAKQYIDARKTFAGCSIEVCDAKGVLLASVPILAVAGSDPSFH